MNAQNLARAVLCVLVIAAAPAVARVTSINITTVEPFAEGASFGETGAYERVKGTFKGELDPADPCNRVIVNLDKAPFPEGERCDRDGSYSPFAATRNARGANGATRACLSKSAMATTRDTWNASWRPLTDSLPIACCCARTPSRSSRELKSAETTKLFVQ